MLEVAREGGPMLVHRPWTLEDIRSSMTHLPVLHEVGGRKFGDEIQIFCREFRPTTHELRRLLMAKLVTDWVKVSREFPEDVVHLINPQWDNGVRYRAQIMALQQRLMNTFPVRLDMTKTAMCKQQDSETVSQYLSRLTEIHDTNSGLEKPDALADGQAAVTAWEAHLRNRFMIGMKPEIAAIVKQQCITWDTRNLTPFHPMVAAP
ncbi:uncharacterized protein LOC128611548 [Ictalurus furcatus]|uniref:uncharacterized protein LOC128611548 n=1 Tax=Ictalurus furcatus TaxID=66913 RepID=UPI002350F0B6|nr:uncharacterized protein LOC128611548 [Ictalurus furcatus]